METGSIPLQLQGYILVFLFTYLLETIERYPGIIQLLRNPHLHGSIIVILWRFRYEIDNIMN